jgi:Homeobox KN domain
MAEECNASTDVISNWLIDARRRKWRPALRKSISLNRPADMLLEDSIRIFDHEPIRDLFTSTMTIKNENIKQQQNIVRVIILTLNFIRWYKRSLVNWTIEIIISASIAVSINMPQNILVRFHPTYHHHHRRHIIFLLRSNIPVLLCFFVLFFPAFGWLRKKANDASL